MELVLVTHRSCAAFHIAYIRSFVGHYEGPLELAGSGCIDTEIA